MTTETFRTYIETNLIGAFNVLQAAARAMLAREEGGRLVAIGSVNAVAAERGRAPMWPRRAA